MEPAREEEEAKIQQRHEIDSGRNVESKRIIICCDGTWQSAVSGERHVPSNVTRLCRAINPIGSDADGKLWQQLVWYDSGVGTTSGRLGKALEGATGTGLEGNVIEAYNFCALNYNPGDQIMVFGFSRGAYTARTIAGVITDIGLCHQDDLNKFPELWTQYKEFKGKKENKGKRFFRSKGWYEWMWAKADEKQGAGDSSSGFIIKDGKHGNLPDDDMWPKLDAAWAQHGSRNVEVVGVYDTVGALGMPEVAGMKIPQGLFFWQEAPWHNVGLSTNIKYAFQALAIDERRKAFEPTLFYVPPKPDVNLEEIFASAEETARNAFLDALNTARDLKGVNKSPPTDQAVNDAAKDVNKKAEAWNHAVRRYMNFKDKRKPPTKLAQVWFPGYHINVGGGSSSTMGNKGNMEEMSNIAYAWMLDRVKQHLSINEKHIKAEYDTREGVFKANNEDRKKWDIMTKDEGWGAWMWRRSSETASSIIHPRTPGPEPPFKKARFYDWGTGEMEDSFTPMYWLNLEHIRTPGRYHFKNGHRNEPLGETFEYIHPVVQYRMEHAKDEKGNASYVPNGPKYERKLIDAHGPNPYYVWHLKYSFDKKFITLPEWELGADKCYERRAIIGKTAEDWVGHMDTLLKKVDPKPRRRQLHPVDPEDEQSTNGGLTHGSLDIINEVSYRSLRSKTVQSTVSEINSSERLESSTLYVI
ncbi:uncharacterized protein N7483_012479 [Penicillium malachiteum]|uniref:uncharacterized protein n=1 Tax=Penicillium malachiteum TaxID=1324776 RepID=UPI0025492A24|nr:uncharacterized protein N7483_012479 [Penicillium malachiteum]KAJ5715298.1 hypothetical protein N7483_012479 [Penicillium malachiteum]